jgi:hypothetical protein
MDPTKMDPMSLARKFKWMSNSVIKLINEEGIEKIVDVHNGFSEISSGSVPNIIMPNF